MSSRRWRRRPGEDGQAYLDLVLSIPILVALTFLVIQGIMAVAAIDVAGKAAREAGRAASLGQSPGAAAQQAAPSWVHVTKVAQTSCADVCMEVTVHVPMGVTLLGNTAGMDFTRSAVFPRGDR